MREANSYQTKIKLSQPSLTELKWWKENLLIQNGKPLKIGMSQLIIQTNASKTGWRPSIREPPRWDLVISGKDKTYQCTGAHCSETFNIDLYHREIRNINPLAYRQYGSSVLLGKNGKNSQSRTATSSQGNIGLSVSQSNSGHSRTLTKQSEYSARLAIHKSQRFELLEIEAQNIFSDCENQKNTSNRPTCFPTELSVTKIHALPAVQ